MIDVSIWLNNECAQCLKAQQTKMNGTCCHASCGAIVVVVARARGGVVVARASSRANTSASVAAGVSRACPGVPRAGAGGGTVAVLILAILALPVCLCARDIGSSLLTCIVNITYQQRG